MWLVAISLAWIFASVGGLGMVLAFMVLFAAGFVHLSLWWASRPGPAAGDPASAVSTPIAGGSRASEPEGVPGNPVRLSSDGRQAVAGEYYHRADIQRSVGGRPVGNVGEWDSGLSSVAYLIREPLNPHDRNAAAVRLPFEGKTVLAGYLPADTTRDWQPLLREMESNGDVAESLAMIYQSGDGNYQVVLHLAPPESARLLNAPPPGEILEARRECAVTGERHHQEVLQRRQPGPVWASLHYARTESGKYAGEPTLEVRIDNQPIGLLTATQGQHYSALLAGGPVVCEALIFNGPRSREVSLRLPRVD